MSCSSFFATTENQKLIRPQGKHQNFKKIDKNQSRVKLLFANLLQSTN